MGNTVLLMGHGTRDLGGVAQFLELVQSVQRQATGCRVHAGFLEFGGAEVPSLEQAFVACAEEATMVRAIPLLLHQAGHGKADIPAAVAAALAAHRGLQVEMTSSFFGAPELIEIAEERIEQALGGNKAPLADTTVLLVGRGTSDAEANADFFRTGRLMWERSSYGSVECAFASLAEPRVPGGIERCVRLGARVVVVIPYFIHGGVLVTRIREQAEAAQSSCPEVGIVVGNPLGPHDKLVKLILDRMDSSVVVGRA